MKNALPNVLEYQYVLLILKDQKISGLVLKSLIGISKNNVNS